MGEAWCNACKIHSLRPLPDVRRSCVSVLTHDGNGDGDDDDELVQQHHACSANPLSLCISLLNR